MSSYSLGVRVSRPDTVQRALDQLLLCWPDYDELLLAVSPNFDNTALRKLSRRYSRIRQLPGAGSRKDIGRAQYTLLDACQSNWLINADDDDCWLHAYDLNIANDDACVLHGSTIYYRPWLAPAKRLQTFYSSRIKRVEDIRNAVGSFQAWRIEAWRAVRDKAWQTPIAEYDAWRVYFYMMRAGWTLQAYKHITGIVYGARKSSSNNPEVNQGWPHYCAILENRGKDITEC